MIKPFLKKMKAYTLRITALPINIHNPVRKVSLSPALRAVKEQESGRFRVALPSSLRAHSLRAHSLRAHSELTHSELTQAARAQEEFTVGVSAHTLSWSRPADRQVPIPGLPGESGVVTS